MRSLTPASLVYLLLLALGLAGCDAAVDDEDDGRLALSPDDVGITFDERREGDQLYFDLTFENNSDYDLRGVQVTVRLLEGDRILASKDLTYVDGLGQGQSVEEEMRFFNFYEDHDAYGCYEYDLQVLYTPDPPVEFEREKSYSGTCN